MRGGSVLLSKHGLVLESAEDLAPSKPEDGASLVARKEFFCGCQLQQFCGFGIRRLGAEELRLGERVTDRRAAFQTT